MEQEHIARRRNQAEVKKEMEAGRTYYKEMKPTLAELRLILKQGENRITFYRITVESQVSSVSRWSSISGQLPKAQGAAMRQKIQDFHWWSRD